MKNSTDEKISLYAKVTDEWIKDTYEVIEKMRNMYYSGR